MTISTSCSRKRSSRRRSLEGQSLPSARISRVAVTRGPFGDIGVKALSIFDDGREQQQLAACRFSRCSRRPTSSRVWASTGTLAFGAILRAEPRKEQAEEMINFSDGGHRALAAARGWCVARC